MIDRRSYSGVLYVLLTAATLGAGSALAAGEWLKNPGPLDVAVALVLAAGVVLGISLAHSGRLPASPQPADVETASAEPAVNTSETDALSGSDPVGNPTARLRSGFAVVAAHIRQRRRNLTALDLVRIGTGAIGCFAALAIFTREFPETVQIPLVAGIGAGLTLAAAGFAATVAAYLVDLDPAQFPEAPSLCRGARVMTWMLVLAAASIGLSFFEQRAPLSLLHFLMLAVVTAMAISLLLARPQHSEAREVFPLDFGVLSLLGDRPNVLASMLDSAEQQLGIDLRSSWALTIVRHSLEPLLVALCVLAWLSTSLTVVGAGEQALVERLGVALTTPPLPPGLHLHWPWPIDKVIRFPVRRVQVIRVGDEDEEGGARDVLWARRHTGSEYTLLLGDGRDLITIDAAVQFRIVDPRAWHYRSQNPAAALKAIAYRAVMRSTVNLTLSEALSQNMVALTRSTGSMVQKEANDLGLGVELVGFTVGGMHPPVPVADAYQAVGSAELGKVTAVMKANVVRNSTVPFAQASVYSSLNATRAQAAEALARASGEAKAFRLLDAQFRSAPQDYMLSRRLEALEKGLLGRKATIVDNRFERDGGILWVTP